MIYKPDAIFAIPISLLHHYNNISLIFEPDMFTFVPFGRLLLCNHWKDAN